MQPLAPSTEATSHRPRVAFVVQRYARDLVGGAEYQCRLYAELLSDACDVTVLTTDASDYRTWEPDLTPGVEVIGGVEVHRFHVTGERHPQHQRWWERWSGRRATLAEEWQWIHEQGPVCPDLLAHLATHGRHYDVIFFFTYLYHPTVMGLPLVADRAVLVPTANPGEVEIFLHHYRTLLGLPREILYCSPEEREWVHKTCGNKAVPSELIGIPLPCAQLDADLPDRDAAKAAVAALGIDRPYLLFLGRVSPSKGCDDLLECYRQYRESRTDPVDLVLAGTVELTIPDIDGVHALGPVHGHSKNALLARCLALVNPSRFDCYSISVHEAWAYRRPVLVFGETPVLAGLVARSDGGITFRDAESLGAAIDALANDPGRADVLGRAGRSYVEKACDQTAVRSTLLASIDRVMGSPGEQR